MSTTNPTGAPRPLEVGDQLGQYKLVELLAIGGMALVYRAYDSSLDRYVAIKVLKPELASDPEIAKRFLNEARAAAALNHPNIVHVYAAGEQAGAVFFAMELVMGDQIETLLTRQGQIPVRESVEFIRQAVRGLQHAHEHGLIHGDVKPANFLVSENGMLKVSDFGLVRHVKASSGKVENESLYGTPGYISPEVITGRAADHRSDIYSLGATLFHMLAGRPPFLGATTDETLRMHTQAPVPSIQTFNSNVPVALAQIVTRMLAKNPAARYQSYTELLQTLDRYLGERHMAGVRPLLKNNSGQKQTPVAAPAKSTTPSYRELSLNVILTLISVIGCAAILYFVFVVYPKRNGKVSAGKSTAGVIANPVPAPSNNREVQAANEFKTLRVTAEAAAADGQLGRADEIYTKWPAEQFSGTSASQAVNAERIRLRSTAGQQWQAAQTEIKTLRAAGKFAEAIAVCDRQAHVCAGFADLPDEIDGLRRKIDQEQKTKITATKAVADAAKATADATAAAEAAIVQARQAKLQQLQSDLTVLITGLQWDKGRQVVQNATAEAGKDAIVQQELIRWQSQFDGLLALRSGMSARLKAAPSAPVTLTTKRGDFNGQITGFDANRVVLRQTLGAAGFAEIPLAWNDLTPASVCRLFFTGLDSDQPEEMFGYAVFLANQALTQQARVEDARQTLQAVASRLPAKAVVLESYLKQLAEFEKVVQGAVALRQREAGAAALWLQLQANMAQNQWSKAGDVLAALTSDFSNTEFVKTHAGDCQRFGQIIAQHLGPKGFTPLDIGAACNASFFEHGDTSDIKVGFSRSALIGDLPNNGRVLLHDMDPGGQFQLRIMDNPDSIGLAWATGRFPSSVIVKLPASQQRRYSQLAILSASSMAGATISARFTYDTGDSEELKLKTYDWINTRLPKDANVGTEVASVTRSDRKSGCLYLNLIEIDKQRRLMSIAFTWISAGTENPQHCVGVFAISGLPVDK